MTWIYCTAQRQQYYKSIGVENSKDYNRHDCLCTREDNLALMKHFRLLMMFVAAEACLESFCMAALKKTTELLNFSVLFALICGKLYNCVEGFLASRRAEGSVLCTLHMNGLGGIQSQQNLTSK